MLKWHSIESSTASIEFIEGKIVTASFVFGSAKPLLVSFFFCEEPRSKGQMKIEWTPDIPVITGDGLAHDVACLQILDSSLEVWDLIEEILLDTQWFSNVKVC